MSEEPEDTAKLPQRHRPAHQAAIQRENRTIIQFVTVCTQERRPVLANATIHEILVNIWQQHTRFHVGRYVIMPDHLHLFCAPGTSPPESLGPWIRFWKSNLAKQTQGTGKLWQRNYWDTQLRAHESYATKWLYVRNNPVRAGLVQSPDDWPFQGEVFPLRWHD